ncbi:hypothetical protein LGR82_14800 [Enterobacter hormaechei]|uniref:hypothetical protein n=1 Tax=Enterobacter hormaechei TaxID=158836 RepID=UPI001F281DA7|nr:hypothetical protein [Enterobacter hormaechei]MCF2392724.1 hypothetical protein [Enterobacter hormaechei]
MSTLTKEWLLKTIAELEEERDATPGAVNEDAAMALAAMKLALVSLEAEHAGFIVKHKVTGKFGSWLHSKADWFRSDEYEVLKAYTAPPAPVSVPDAMEMDDDFDSAFEHGKAVGWNAYRAAMLQSFGNSEQLNSPVIPDGWVLVPEEPTHEMLEAGDEQFGTYDVYRRMIAASPQQK